MDFYKLRTKRTKDGLIIYPDFVVHSSKDLLVKGGAFYAVWDESRGLWSRDEMDVVRMVDDHLSADADKLDAIPLLMSSYESKSWTSYKQYIDKLSDSSVDLDQSLTFADDAPDRSKYASRRLPYALTEAPTPAWDEIVGTLYAPEEREKIEWAIGSIVSGDSRKNQKFLVFYGDPGTGKSTIMLIVEKLFEGYTVPFDAKAMTQSSNQFSLAAFKSSPLVAIQQDGDLSRIEDNTRLNSIVSHEMLPINEKYRSEYYTRAIAFLMLGTNDPVKITGSKSGILRRLIDCHPTGHLIENKKYHALMAQIDFELGAIAKHCLGVYLRLGKNYYANYRPTSMIRSTDTFFNFIEEYYDTFFLQDGVTLDRAWQLYKEYCEEASIRQGARLPKNQFGTELRSYFEKVEERVVVDGQRVRNYYSGFKTGRFVKVDDTKPLALVLDEKTSLLDDILADMPAQYATSSGTPKTKWENVTTKLSDLDTSKLHYVKVPENHIVIDFDLKDENGNKSRERNLEAAAEWPPTYTEYSQGGGGVHLHYYYDGPGSVAELSPMHGDGIEVKSLLGNSSLRRRYSQSNNVAIATISSGLALKEKPLRDSNAMKSERTVRRLIIENLQKKHCPSTKSSIDFIKKILDDAFTEGFPFDVSDLYADVYSFAMDSTNNARYCMNLVNEMKFMSEEMELKTKADSERIVFYDVEVFPNLFVICWKYAGEHEPVVTMINPTAQQVDELLKLRLVGFNCRRYDNHIVYAAAMGYTIEQLYDLSQRIVEYKDKEAMFGAAYDISYTDIYDFSSVKQGLKKWEIELGIHHMELGLPWNQPVPEDMWELVAKYCGNDVLATEATFNKLRADFNARRIIAELSGLSVNHSTNSHSARIIFGNNRKPQSAFVYTDLSEMFPGYEYEFGKSTYRGEITGEGGYVYAEPGFYHNVALLDVASMHPTSIENLNLFGEEYTARFSELKNVRIAIKRGDFDSARRMMDGKLAPYLEDEEQAKELSDALKIVINSVYGVTSAKYENPFKDPRNKDNIVAKRGALFMVDLKHAVQERGFTVAHIKTDSIKIPDATPEIIDFVFKFGEQYGYEFEHEATYEDFILFNDAVYIAKNTKEAIAKAAAKGKTKPLWEATGAQFQHPYVYKKLLSGEPIEFSDLFETKQVAKGEIFIIKKNGDVEESRRFVGRIGQFVAMLPGSGGGLLTRVAPDTKGEIKDYAVTGTKGWEWLEAETVRELKLEDFIDFSYYDHLVQQAREALEKAGCPPWDPIEFMQMENVA